MQKFSEFFLLTKVILLLWYKKHREKKYLGAIPDEIHMYKLP